MTKSPPDADWITWPQAAALVGCPVPTIDWYTRVGRIEKRPFRGAAPTLKRASVNEFASWWRERQEERVRRHDQAAQATRRRPPRPAGWLNTAEAANELSISQSHVSYLIGQGKLVGQRHGRRWWVNEASVDRLADERTRWVSYAAAAEIVGCSTKVIARAAKRGMITRRIVPRQYPCLERASVEALGRLWQAEQHGKRVAEELRRRKNQLGGRPDSQHDWLTERDAAAHLGISRSRVGQLARSGRLPMEQVGRRRWYRRDHIELVVAARAFRVRSGQACRRPGRGESHMHCPASP